MTALVLLSLLLSQVNVDFTSTSVPFSNSPYEVEFSLSNVGITVDSVLWDFGDGRTSTERSPSHTYLNSGAFDVKLTVFYKENNVDTSYTIVKPKHVVTYCSKKAPWSAREGHASAVFGSKLWIFGGYSADPARSNVRLNDVWNTSDGSTWERVTEAATWSPRSSFTVTSYHGSLWLIGGITGEGEASGEVWSSSDGVTWTQLGVGDVIPPRYSHASIEFLDNIYILGGRNFTTGGLTDLTTFDGVNFTQVLEQGPWGVLCGHSMSVIPVNEQSTLIVSGGSNGDSLNRSIFLSSDGLSWRSNAFGKLTEGYASSGISSNPEKLGWSEFTKSFVTFLDNGSTGQEPCIIRVSTEWQHMPSIYLLGDMNPGITGSYLDGISEISTYMDSTVGLGSFFVSLDNGTLGCEPYVVQMGANPEDCTISLMADIATGVRSSNPRNFRFFGISGAFFLANDYVHGEEIWAYHSTEGLTLFSDLNDNAQSSDIRFFEKVQNSLRGISFVVLADNPIASGDKFFVIRCGKGSWVEDLSKPSDFSEPDLVEGAYAHDGNIYFPTVVPLGVVFVSGIDDAKNELWTIRIEDEVSAESLYNFGDYEVRAIQVAGSTVLVFVEGTNGTSVWKTDGKTAPTKAYDVDDSIIIDYGSNWTEVGNFVFFTATDPTTGKELWKASALGLSQVKDINPGLPGSSPSLLSTNGSYLYFSADNVTYGTEIWKTDGTSLGTKLFYDAWYGKKTSNPSELHTPGKDIIFVAEDSTDNRQWFYVQDNEMAPYSKTVSASSDMFSSDGNLVGNAFLQISMDNSLFELNIPAIASTPWYRSTPEENTVVRIDSVTPAVLGTDTPVDVELIGDFSSRTSSFEVMYTTNQTPDYENDHVWEVLSESDSLVHALSSLRNIGKGFLYVTYLNTSSVRVYSNMASVDFWYGNQGKLGNYLGIIGAGCDTDKSAWVKLEGYVCKNMVLPFCIYPTGSAIAYTGTSTSMTWDVFVANTIPSTWPSTMKLRYCTLEGRIDPYNDTELTITDSSQNQVTFNAPILSNPSVIYVYISYELPSDPSQNCTSSCRPLYVINQQSSVLQEEHVFAESVMLPVDTNTTSWGRCQILQRGDMSSSMYSFRLLIEHNVPNPVSLDVYDSNFKTLLRLTASDMTSPLNFSLPKSFYTVLKNRMNSDGIFTEDIYIAVRSEGYDFGEVRGLLKPKDYVKITNGIIQYSDVTCKVTHTVSDPTGAWIEKNGVFVAPVICDYESPLIYKIPVSTMLSLSDYSSDAIGVFLVTNKIELVIANEENPRGFVRASVNAGFSMPSEPPPTGFFMDITHSTTEDNTYAVLEDFDGNPVLQTQFVNGAIPIQCSYGIAQAVVMNFYSMFSNRIRIKLCDPLHPEGFAFGKLVPSKNKISENRYIGSYGYPVSQEYEARYFPDTNFSENTLVVVTNSGGYGGTIPINVSGYLRKSEYLDLGIAGRVNSYIGRSSGTITLEAPENPPSYYFVKWIDDFDGEFTDKIIHVRMLKNRAVTAVFSTSPPGGEGEGEGEGVITSLDSVTPNSIDYTDATSLTLEGTFENPENVDVYFAKVPGKYYPEFDYQGKNMGGNTSSLTVEAPIVNGPLVSEIYLTPKGHPETISSALPFSFVDTPCYMKSISSYNVQYSVIPLRVYKDTYLNVRMLPYLISGYDPVIAVYCGTFDPLNPADNLVLVKDDGYGAYSLPKISNADGILLEEDGSYSLVVYSKRSINHLSTPQESTFMLEFGDNVRPLSSDVWYSFMNNVPIPSPGSGMTSSSYDGKIWLVGGFRGNDPRSSIQVYDPNSIFSDIFREYYPVEKEFSFLSHHTSEIFQDRIWFIGGGGSLLRNNVVYFTSSQKQPTVDFTIDPLSGPKPLKVTYTDTSDSGEYPVTNWSWDFGDGGVSSQETGEHTFSVAGTYSVTLTITTDISVKTLTKEDYIEVTP